MKCPRCGLVTFDHLHRCPRCEQSFDLVRPLTGRSGALGPLVVEDAEAQKRLRDRLHDARLSRRKRTANPLSGGDDPDAPDWFEPEPVTPDGDNGRGTDEQDEPGPPAASADAPEEETASVSPPDSDRDERRSSPVAVEDQPGASSGADPGDGEPDDPGSATDGESTAGPRDPVADGQEPGTDPQEPPSGVEATDELPLGPAGDKIEGFQDWREELRVRLQRIRARKEQERGQRAAAARAEPEVSAPAEPEGSPPTDSEAAPATDSEVSPPTDPELSPATDSEVSPPTDPELSPATDSEVSPTPETDAGSDERSLDELLDDATLDRPGEPELDAVTVVGATDEIGAEDESAREPRPGRAEESEEERDPLADAELQPGRLRITGAVDDPFRPSESDDVGRTTGEELAADHETPQTPGKARSDDVTPASEGNEDAGATPALEDTGDRQKSDLEEPDLEELDLEEPDLEELDLEEPDLEESDLEEPDLEEPDLEEPDEPDLEEPDLKEPEPRPGDEQDVGEPRAEAADAEEPRAEAADADEDGPEEGPAADEERDRARERSVAGDELDAEALLTDGGAAPEAEVDPDTGEEPELEFEPVEEPAASVMDFDVDDADSSGPPAGPAWDADQETEEVAAEPGADSISPSAGPLGERAAATACDGLVLVAIAACLVSAAASATGQSLTTILVEVPVPLTLAWAVFAVGYGLFFNATCGQTIGRMVMKLRVVSSDEFSVGLQRAAVRMVASWLSLLPVGLGALPAVRDPQRRTLHDRISRTRVVKA